MKTERNGGLTGPAEAARRADAAHAAEAKVAKEAAEAGVVAEAGEAGEAAGPVVASDGADRTHGTDRTDGTDGSRRAPAVRAAAGSPVPQTAPVDGTDAEAYSRFVEGFASQLVEAGLPRMPARVFAALLASEDGVLTSAELGEKLRVSPAGVSGAIRYLAQVDMVTRERDPGSRRERYRVHRDQWYEALASRDGVLRRWESSLREGVAALGPDTRPGRRMAETLEFFTFMHEELDGMLERWRVHRDQVFGED